MNLGLLTQMVGARRQTAAAAQVAERDAIARDLHDGLAQDLAFLAGRLRELATKAELENRGDKDLLSTLSLAARRALDESRVAIWSLASADASIEVAVERTAEEIADREGGSVLVTAEPGVEVSQECKHALLCIVREAVTNAMRHGQPTQVEVRLSRDAGIRLEVSDDGRGFDGDSLGGFGLTSIQQRAATCGGNAEIISRIGKGTAVVVDLPPQAIADEQKSRLPFRTPERLKMKLRPGRSSIQPEAGTLAVGHASAVSA